METISSGNNKQFSYISFFDLDNTLTEAISGREIVRTAQKKGLMSHSDLAKAVFLLITYKLKLKDPLRIINKMTGWIKGLPEDRLTDLFYEVFHEALLPSFFPEAVNEIKRQKDQNAKLVILSSSLTPICLRVADYLGMDDVICTDLEVINGFYTGKSLGAFCYGEEKAIRMKDYCERNNNTCDNAWYYADSISDLPALRLSGFPVCVNPDRKLKKAAEKNGWIIYNWK